MHFYEKRVTIKVVSLIEFFQIVIPKFGPDVFNSYYRAPTKYFDKKHLRKFKIPALCTPSRPDLFFEKPRQCHFTSFI